MRLPRLLLPAAAALAATVLAAGCGGAGGTGPAVATDHVQMAKSYRFDPDVIRIKAGDTVTWTNNDNFTHSVQLLDGGLPTEPMVMNTGGGIATFTFTQAGTFHYQCSFHPQNMKGTVVVTP